MTELEEISQKRTICREGRQIEQWLVKQKQFEDRTWEDVQYLQKQFPHLNLEGKVFSPGDGFVTKQAHEEKNKIRSREQKQMIVYKRRTIGKHVAQSNEGKGTRLQST